MISCGWSSPKSGTCALGTPNALRPVYALRGTPHFNLNGHRARDCLLIAHGCRRSCFYLLLSSCRRCRSPRQLTPPKSQSRLAWLRLPARLSPAAEQCPAALQAEGRGAALRAARVGVPGTSTVFPIITAGTATGTISAGPASARAAAATMAAASALAGRDADRRGLELRVGLIRRAYNDL